MNILLSSVGRRSYMVNYFKDALKGIGLVHASNCTETYAMQLADKSVTTPLIHDESYIYFLIEYCQYNKLSVIIPLHDIDLNILSNNKNNFLRHSIQVIVSDYVTIQICNDKWLTYGFLKENGLNTPKTFILIKEVEEAIALGQIHFPLIIKPRWGMGSLGIFEVENQSELEILYNKAKHKIFSSYLKYASNLSPDKAIIIQEKIIGEEVDLDILSDLEGNYLTGVAIKVLEMRAGESDKVEIINDKALTKIGQEISKKLKFISCWNIDTIKANNIHYILEINCRFNGLSPFSYLSGTNFPKAIVQLLLKNPVKKNLLKVKIGTICVKDLVPVILK